MTTDTSSSPETTATHPLRVEDTIELAVLERSGLIESRHLGAAVIVDGSGRILRALGDPSSLIYPRSSLKPLQAIAVLRSGVALSGEKLALATASHIGTSEHVRVVRDILGLAHIDEAALGCPDDWPRDTDSRLAVVAAGGGAAPVYMNCSGKHAAFLLACSTNGWPLEGYLDPSHPLQELIVDVVEEFTGEPVVHSGIDGCGAPVHAVSLTGLARAIGRISRGADDETLALAEAFRQNGWAIAGPGQANTVTIDTLGIVAKLGAEGVMVMGAADGTAVAVKMLDGNVRAATLVALELLVGAGVVSRDGADAVNSATLEKVLGAGQPVGEIRLAF